MIDGRSGLGLGPAWFRKHRAAIVLALAGVTAAGVCLAGCAGHPAAAVTVTAKANQTTINVARGTIVTVKLAENPTTGYEWKMIVGPGLSQVGSKFVAPSPSGLVGVGGTHVWTIKAEKAGTRTLTGVYERSWETKSAASFSLTMVVK